jgi:hypothetical protein
MECEVAFLLRMGTKRISVANTNMVTTQPDLPDL